MLFFSKKEKVRLDEFCRDFYDKNFLEPIIAEMDMSDTYNELILKNLKEVDNKSNVIKHANFKNEILILRFELFSLAWFHQFGDKLAISASVGVPIFCKPKHPGRERRRLVSDQRQQCNLPPTLVQVYKKEDGLAQE